MRHPCLFVVTIVCLVTILEDRTEAQVAFGVTQQNGVISGGGLRIGGIVSPDRTRVRFGISAGLSNLVGVNTFRVSGPVAANNASWQQPSAEQFVAAAQRFDRDRDERLNQEELKRVGAAVLAELRQRPPRCAQRPRMRGGLTGALTSSRSQISDQQIMEAFVARCMTFDADKDNALDAAETKRMAAALIRSLT